MTNTQAQTRPDTALTEETLAMYLPRRADQSEQEFWSEVVAARLAEVAAIIRHYLPERKVCEHCLRRLK